MRSYHRGQYDRNVDRNTNRRRARVVERMDWKPIVTSRASSSPADNAMCNGKCLGYEGRDAGVSAWKQHRFILVLLLGVELWESSDRKMSEGLGVALT